MTQPFRKEADGRRNRKGRGLCDHNRDTARLARLRYDCIPTASGLYDSKRLDMIVWLTLIT